MKAFTVTFVVSSESSEKLRLAKQLVAGKTQADSVLADIGRANDRVYVEQHRLGDYFSSVRVADSSPTSFEVVFEPRPNADRYWKDLVVKIIGDIRESGVSVESDRVLRRPNESG